MPRCSPSSQQSPVSPSPPGAPLAVPPDAAASNAPASAPPGETSATTSDDAIWLAERYANFRAFVSLLLDRVPAARGLVPGGALDLSLTAFLTVLRLDPGFAVVAAASQRGDRAGRDRAAAEMVAEHAGALLDADDDTRLARYLALWGSV